MSHHDVVVVGGGLAGLSAAVRLAEEGARVLVVAKGVGATHLGPCTIDVLGYAPQRVERPLEALAGLGPAHPDALGGAEAVTEAAAWFTSRFDGPYGYAGSPDVNLLLPTAIGAPKPSALVPVTMAAGNVDLGGAVCVVGFRALKDFHAALLADNLTRLTGVRARAVELDLEPEGRVDASPVAFARAFDTPAFRALVVAALAPRLGADERVAVPAALGFKDPHGVWSELQERLGRPVFEIPTVPPSVPGQRVFAVLRERLRRAGGAMILNAVVTGADGPDGRIDVVHTRTGLRDVRHGTDWVVLATGGVASGGIELDSTWRARETALGLPVAGVPGPGGQRFVPGYFDPQPMARAGVAVDAGQRPVDAAGARVYDNVLVAGATLAGAEPWREKSGDGISLTTGHRAAGLILGAREPATPATTTTGG